jgi:hypothetical protein
MATIGEEDGGVDRMSGPQLALEAESGGTGCSEMEINAGASVAEVSADGVDGIGDGASISSNGPSGCDVGIFVACYSSMTHYNFRWSVNITSIISSSSCTGLVVMGNGVGSGGCASADLMPTITSIL